MRPSRAARPEGPRPSRWFPSTPRSPPAAPHRRGRRAPSRRVSHAPAPARRRSRARPRARRPRRPVAPSGRSFTAPHRDATARLHQSRAATTSIRAPRWRPTRLPSSPRARSTVRKPCLPCVGRGGVQRHVDVDCPDLRSGGRAWVACEEIGGEVAAGDLRRRPPQRLPRREHGVVARGRARAHEVRRGAGQQHPAQDGRERRRLDRSAVPCRDVLGDCFGLLGGDPALLDREVGRVAGRVHAAPAAHRPC